MPKKCFSVVLNAQRQLFPKKCAMCTHRAKLSAPSSLTIDMEIKDDAIRNGVETCDMYVDTKPYIVKLGGLATLALDTDQLDPACVFPWRNWVPLRHTPRAFRLGRPAPTALLWQRVQAHQRGRCHQAARRSMTWCTSAPARYCCKRARPPVPAIMSASYASASAWHHRDDRHLQGVHLVHRDDGAQEGVCGLLYGQAGEARGVRHGEA